MKCSTGILLLSWLAAGPVLAQRPNAPPHGAAPVAPPPGGIRRWHPAAQPPGQFQPPRPVTPPAVQPQPRVAPPIQIQPPRTFTPPRYYPQPRTTAPPRYQPPPRASTPAPRHQPPPAAPYNYDWRRGRDFREHRGDYGPSYGWDARRFEGRRFHRPHVDAYRYRYGYSHLPRFQWFGTWGLVAPLTTYSYLSFLDDALLLGSYYEDGRIIYVYLVDEDGVHREIRVDEFGNVLSETIVP